ncbi:MAG: hypothetical protein JW749_06230 [Sedimentisphaerales bacterium]|nr:hypothetical protein [Sedimentisphaerales bacterium]
MKKIKKYLWLASLFILTLLVFALVLITHRPGRYAPVKVADKNLISPYVTHQILPKLYNGSQLGEPFEIVITQDGLNDIIARWPLPLQLDSITLTDPQVIFLPDHIILMATVGSTPIDLFVSIKLMPSINKQGQLILNVNNVSIGAVDITPLALSMGKKAYSDWLTSTGNDPDDIAAQICRSLLNDEPFEPTFEMYNKMLRVSNLVLDDGKLTISLIPIPESKTN